MQTSFTLAQLADPQTAEAEKILRACVHCGFCTATCPTYVLLGDELDSPRGRIYLIKEILEQDRPATAEVVKHIDRCLSCLSCMTTCPSGVHYMHLVDHARDHIEKTYKRPLTDRLIRGLLARVLPDPALFRWAAVAGLVGKPFAPALKALGLKRLGAMLSLTPGHVPAPPSDRQDRKSTRLNSSHMSISYAVFCLKKKNKNNVDERAGLLMRLRDDDQHDHDAQPLGKVVKDTHRGAAAHHSRHW